MPIFFLSISHISVVARIYVKLIELRLLLVFRLFGGLVI